ncbi:acylneuraminate cytidylyltransferase [Pseudovibrio exalbescens]|uniref:acylneuraminate cytidylyltransferase n=1 Tax=Pseudovibrio exalbescens TaxID=197461 RepID=UPI000C9B7F45|nr:acylneuraminate cytidylyltransferase [Pseudovibrio exalbescens]
MTRVIAVIPARGGSKGLPGKNIRELGGVPLVERTVKAAHDSKYISEVCVSSDCSEILSVARRAGAKCIRRPDALSGAEAPSESALLHALGELEISSSDNGVLVFLQCTSPFTTGEDIDRVLTPVLHDGFDSAFSASSSHGFIWGVDEKGRAYGISHDHKLPRQRRQDMSPQYLESGAIYVMRFEAFLREKTRFCGCTTLIAVDAPQIEIDTFEDWRLAEVYINSLKQNACKQEVPVRALVTDFDGVHTDDCVYVSEIGQEFVKCSRSDGYGLEQLKKKGLKLLILSKERNSVVEKRADKLGMQVLQSVDRKEPVLEAWLQENGLMWDQIAYVGNDLNDIECLRRAGWGFAPSNSHHEVKAIADFVLTNKGGDGAIREVCEWLLDKDLVVK